MRGMPTHLATRNFQRRFIYRSNSERATHDSPGPHLISLCSPVSGCACLIPQEPAPGHNRFGWIIKHWQLMLYSKAVVVAVGENKHRQSCRWPGLLGAVAQCCDLVFCLTRYVNVCPHTWPSHFSSPICGLVLKPRDVAEV